MSNNSPVDYAAVLADLESKLMQIQSAIAAIKALQMDQGKKTAPPIKSKKPATKHAKPASQPASTGIFSGLSVREAARKYMVSISRDASTSEIIAALKNGGQPASKGKNYGVVVATTLRRSHETGGDFQKVGTGLWALKKTQQ